MNTDSKLKPIVSRYLAETPSYAQRDAVIATYGEHGLSNLYDAIAYAGSRRDTATLIAREVSGDNSIHVEFNMENAIASFLMARGFGDMVFAAPSDAIVSLVEAGMTLPLESDEVARCREAVLIEHGQPTLDAIDAALAHPKAWMLSDEQMLDVVTDALAAKNLLD